MSEKNVRMTYIGAVSSPRTDKEGMLKCLDLGTYCIINNVSQAELKFLIAVSRKLGDEMLAKMHKVSL